MVRLAAAPISWGVSEVGGWGYQMAPDQVLDEVGQLGLTAIEAGPEGFLPVEPGDAARLLKKRRLQLAAAFVPAILHISASRGEQIGQLERQARWLAGAGGEVLVVAAATRLHAYEEAGELSSRDWAQLLDTIASVQAIARRHRLTLAVHPHFGTAIERPEHIERLLVGTDAGLCLDTGHLVIGGADPLEIVELAARRITHVHLKDVDADLAAKVASGSMTFWEGVWRGLFLPLGRGAGHIGPVVEALRKHGYAGWYVLEQDAILSEEPGIDAGPPPAVRESIEFFRALSA